LKKSTAICWLLAPLLFALMGFSFIRCNDIYQNDPDRYYHLALSRYMAESQQWIPRTLPQVTGLGWDQQFQDKEFLFHQLTAAAYRIGGETGTAGAVLALSLLCLLLTYWLCEGLAPPPVALALSLAMASNNYFLGRLSLLRPGVLAVFLFLLLLKAILSRKPWHAFASAALFALSYHALLFPVILLGIAALVFLLFPGDRKQEKRLVLLGFSGLVAGSLVNPYFPANILIAIQHMKIPSLMQGELASAQFGIELYPLSGVTFRNIFGLQIVAILLAAFSLNRAGKQRAELQNLLMLAVSALVLFSLTMQMPRVGEYLVPVSAALLACLYGLWDDQARARLAVLVGLCGYAAIRLCVIEMQPAIGTSNQVKTQARMEAARSIPDRNAAVFSCDWAPAPYLQYARPDLTFTDILDPTFLYFANPKLHYARQKFLDGFVADPVFLVDKVFHSKYVLCQSSAAIDQLQRDPDFTEIFPNSNTAKSLLSYAPRIFRLDSDSSAHFLTAFEASFFRDADGSNLRKLTPANKGSDGNVPATTDITYLDLLQVFGNAGAAGSSRGDALCALVQPDSLQLRRREGAKYIGLGGGRNIRVWRNGQPLYATVNAFTTNSRLQVLVPLAGGLKASDKLELIVCSAKDAAFWGLSLSFWSDSEIATICKRKAKGNGKDSIEPISWPYYGATGDTCLGPVIRAEN
jgi:EpsG family